MEATLKHREADKEKVSDNSEDKWVQNFADEFKYPDDSKNRNFMTHFRRQYLKEDSHKDIKILTSLPPPLHHDTQDEAIKFIGKNSQEDTLKEDTLPLVPRCFTTEYPKEDTLEEDIPPLVPLYFTSQYPQEN
ncbi:hypothetical protein QYM36_014941 [Artemia franciscana]|uniref:Uncharacterized protein n=1 Tax=Artemia franciscana TaxID=6661 RepID=A0AA88HHE6_ARTSF|nr:hypothetical protein QYM36_014941 [Artemia franciscana]